MILQDNKLLIRRRLQKQLITLPAQSFPQLHRKILPAQSFPQLHRKIHRVSADLQIQVVRKKRVKLQAQKPSLGKQTAMLFDLRHEVRRHIFLRKNNCLAKQCPHLRSADIKDVRKRGAMSRIVSSLDAASP